MVQYVYGEAAAGGVEYNVTIFAGAGGHTGKARMPLSLSTRAVGQVTIIRCSGRIVAGNETESLRSHVNGMLLER